MDGMVEDMWTQYKRLYNVCRLSISNPNDASSDLELCLKKYKQNFTNFLRNPPKNEKSRAHLRNLLVEGVNLSAQTRKAELSPELIDEAFIVSEMFDLDEIFAMELLCTAQRLQIHYPGEPRGLVAVLLYYDGRKAIACTLRDMFQTVRGVSWRAELPKDITDIFNNYAQNLVEESNILGRLLELLAEMDTKKEMHLLTKNRALGSKRHQSQVMSIYEETRKAIAMALFNWSAQRGLPKHIAIRLLQQLATVKPADETVKLDDTTLIMLMALLYGYNTSELIADCDSPPILSDPEFAKKFYEAIYAQNAWQTPQLDIIVKYSFGLTMASLRQAPSEVQAIIGETINRDEQLIDEALAENVFGFFYSHLLKSDVVFKTEFIYRRLHLLITDFIDFMHAKVSELRSRADETSRMVISFQTEGFDPPNHLDDNFEMLMLCVAKLYGDKRACIMLCNEYWGPIDSTSTANGTQNTSRAISLFKFIRLGRQLVPQTLFKSYLNMISGLTRTEFAARSAFNLLKSSQNLTATYAVSWEHFFNALSNYFDNMRTDYDVSLSFSSDSLYRSRQTALHMTPRETEHMTAVMGIIEAVAEHDEISRIMLCEQANGQTPQVLLGLVACATPVTLKGDILFALAALAKSKETARSIWQHLEESQIIPTLPVTIKPYPEFSLAEEIEKNECRLDTYRLSRGILRLLYTLMTTHMPRSLGSGPRIPGFDPYLNFVLDNILQKFYNRAYTDPTEKWLVGAECLKLFYFLLASYRPKASDFLEERDEHPYPGYRIMLLLQVKSDMLRLLLRIIEDGNELIDEFNKFHGKELLEECSLYALLLIEMALAKQNAFFEAHASANCSIMLQGLNRMLFDLNPRSRNPDYVLNIIKYVTYNSWLPRHTLAAIKILKAVTMLPNVSIQILNMYGLNSIEMLEIRQRFVECLEMDPIHVPVSDDVSNNEVPDSSESEFNPDDSDMQVDLEALEDRTPQRIELQIKEAIINLFEQNLSQPLPNFVYFLFGIVVLRDFTPNEKQQIDVDVNYVCINSLVQLLEHHLDQQKHTDEYCEHTAHIVERIYHLFYGLCCNHRTSEAILRYFRLKCNDFLVRHLSAMPFRKHTEDHMLHAMSHIMNCMSIEIKLAASHGQTTRYHQLCDLLLAANSETQRTSISTPQEMGNNLLTPATSSYFGVDVLPGRIMQNNSLGLHVNRLLDCLKLETQSVTQPPLEFYNEAQIAQLFVDCEARTSFGGDGIINVHKLHDILHDELRQVQSTIATGQRKTIIMEVTMLLKHAIKRNCIRMQRYATYSFMYAWCKLVQIIFAFIPDPPSAVGVRKLHIIDVIEKILMKVEPKQPLIKISIQATDALLFLSTNLRYCYYRLEDQRALDEQGNMVLSDKPITGDSSVAKGIANISGNSCNTSNLRFIIKRLIEWIMTSEVRSQKLSINLYTTLLNCLRIVKRVRSEEQVEYNETFMSRTKNYKTCGNLQPLDEDLLQKEMAADIMSGIGDKLVDIILHDAITGHDVCGMLALSLLDIISELRAVSTLINVVSTRGYLKQILYSLGKSNKMLHTILTPSPKSLRPLFVYEATMAFLAQLSQTFMGASLLLGEGVLSVLGHMSIYDMQPDLKSSELGYAESDHFLPAIDERFRSILLPALSLCDSILNSLGAQNNSAAVQVLNFLFAHIDMLESMLRAATPFMDLGHLQQLAAITSLFARATTYDVINVEELEMANRVSRLQQLMIVVFGRFTVNETTIRRMLDQERQQPGPARLTDEEKSLHTKYFLDIAANSSLYCHNAVISRARDDVSSKYLLTTMINDVTPLSGKNDNMKLTTIMQVILNQLKGCTAYYLSQKSIAESLLHQRASLPNITFGPNGNKKFLTLTQRYNEKRSELKFAVFIAEQNLYLLWIHLDFYFRNSVIFMEENRNSINETCSDSSNVSVLNASQDEITQLKKTLISTFNETFCSQLITGIEDYATKGKNFNVALLRRIKALIQFAPTS